jgi:transposase
MPIKAIARALGVSRNTVRAALASDGPPKYQRPAAGSSVDAFEPRIRELLGSVRMTASRPASHLMRPWSSKLLIWARWRRQRHAPGLLLLGRDVFDDVDQ